MKLPILNSEHSCDNIFFSPAKAETDLVVSAPDLVELPPSQLYSDPTGTQVWVLAPHPRTGTHLLSHGFLVCKVEKVTPPDFYEHLVYVKRGWLLCNREVLLVHKQGSCIHWVLPWPSSTTDIRPTQPEQVNFLRAITGEPPTGEVRVKRWLVHRTKQRRCGS